ncbi:flavodoxin family protein [Desulfobulbus elongatus]|uniref:flavodoxin family protein n=1 Tax=Desulfobulbus elongatus TaxID=53332 RepID=UPI000480883C|nr:flavodoxin family protein [Desulfobulbus elongatus]
MNILLFNGSPRRRGNTDLLLERIEAAIHQAGHKAEQINLARLDIHPCTGCGHCETEGVCIFKDDMTPLYDKIDAANRIVIGSPIYFCGITAQAKAFIDRCQALWCRKYLLGQIKPEREYRRGYMVSVAAADSGTIFDGTRQTVRYAFDAMECTFSGELLAGGVDGKGAVAGKPELMAEAAHLGQTICRKS